MKANTGKEGLRFSRRAFVFAVGLHVIGSVVLGVLLFTTGMAAFTENVSSKLAFLQALAWLWTPPQMIALRNPTSFLGMNGLLVITLIWSSVVGAAFGYFLPWFAQWKQGG